MWRHIYYLISMQNCMLLVTGFRCLSDKIFCIDFVQSQFYYFTCYTSFLTSHQFLSMFSQCTKCTKGPDVFSLCYFFGKLLRKAATFSVMFSYYTGIKHRQTNVIYSLILLWILYFIFGNTFLLNLVYVYAYILFKDYLTKE